MRPFNLDEYLKNPKLKVITRDGKDVRIICTNAKGTRFPVVALWDFDGKKELIGKIIDVEIVKDHIWYLEGKGVL